MKLQFNGLTPVEQLFLGMEALPPTYREMMAGELSSFREDLTRKFAPYLNFFYVPRTFIIRYPRRFRIHTSLDGPLGIATESIGTKVTAWYKVQFTLRTKTHFPWMGNHYGERVSDLFNRLNQEGSIALRAIGDLKDRIIEVTDTYGKRDFSRAVIRMNDPNVRANYHRVMGGVLEANKLAVETSHRLQRTFNSVCEGAAAVRNVPSHKKLPQFFHFLGTFSLLLSLGTFIENISKDHDPFETMQKIQEEILPNFLNFREYLCIQVIQYFLS